ncbi:MAG: hypothetical protein WC835_00400 [Candidatus Paceibacterota bacterium]|jgi:hypothetical protein
MDLSDPIADLKWLAIIVIVIWAVWVITGGPSRYESKNGYLLKPPSPLSTGEAYGKLPDVKLDIPETLNTPINRGQVALGTRPNLSERNPQKEYLEIMGKSDTPINITGWKLVGAKGRSAVIPQGASVFVSGKTNEKGDIYLARGEKAILISGKSPVGDSFKVNSCSGYLSQFQNFTPALKDSCPSPILPDTLEKYPLNNACLNYINNMDSCKAQISTLPKTISPICRDFIFTRVTYNQCVIDQQKNIDFQKDEEGEWRVYLGSNTELWADHDTIEFYDKGNTPIGAYVY